MLFYIENYPQVSVFYLEFTGKLIMRQLTQLRKAQKGGREGKEGRKEGPLLCTKLPLGKFGSYLRASIGL